MNLDRNHRFLPILALVALLGSGSLEAQVWNVSADFSTTQNPNGPWEYGTAVGSAFTLYATSGPGFCADISTWSDSPGSLPSVWKNLNPLPLPLNPCGSQGSSIGLHPGSADEKSVIRWTAPATGTYTLDATFYGLDPFPTSTDVTVRRSFALGGFTHDLLSGFVNSYVFLSGPTISTAVYMLAGEKIEFRVGYGSNGNYLYDSTGLDATISRANWDAADDFSATQNPNGPWRYGFSTGLSCCPPAPNFTLYTSSGPGPCTELSVWSETPGSLPSLWKNLDANPVTCVSGTHPGLTVGLHPGAAGQQSVIRWTAPEAGSYQVYASFLGLDFVGPTSTDVIVRHITSLFVVIWFDLFTGAVNGYGPGPTYSTTVDMDEGDRIDFLVGFGSNGNYLFDSTGLEATISRTPPASAVPFGSGCGAPPTLTSAAPVLGAVPIVQISNGPANTPSPLFLSLPTTNHLPIGSGCTIYLDLGSTVLVATPVTGVTGIVGLPVSVPPNPALLGAQVTLQAAMLPTASPLGFDLTNGLFFTLGGS